jgi:AcrR family transcriptional regulator
MAAKRAFARHGYAAANVRDIATDEGINASLVIRHFGSKEKLFEVAVTDAFDLERTFAGVSCGELGKEWRGCFFPINEMAI